MYVVKTWVFIMYVFSMVLYLYKYTIGNKNGIKRFINYISKNSFYTYKIM